MICNLVGHIPLSLAAVKTKKVVSFPITYSIEVFTVPMLQRKKGAIPTSAWIKIDPLHKEMGEEVSFGNQNPVYIVSLETYQNRLLMKDVTLKYVNAWGKTSTKRLEDFWQATLLRYMPTIEIGGEEEEEGPIKKESSKDVEDKEMLDKKISEKMPNSLSGFLNHPLFVLEKQLKVNEGIHPKDTVLGLFKTMEVYPRKNVQELFRYLSLFVFSPFLTNTI